MKGRAVRGVVHGLAVGGTVVCMATSCTLAGQAPGPGGDEHGPKIVITPESGTDDVVPNTPVRVAVEKGAVSDVRVEQRPLDGTSKDGTEERDETASRGSVDEDGSVWVSDWNLQPGAEITVYATAEDPSGQETEVVSVFTTVDIEEEEHLSLDSSFPVTGDVVGVGMPVIIDFDRPVENKEQVENSIEIVSEHPVSGAWNWVSDEMAVFRPQEYWEPHQNVRVDARLTGVEASEGVYGLDEHTIEFEVGRELISTMHVPDHEMKVSIDGEHARTIPVSNGTGQRDFNTTTSGIHLTMEKYSSLVMDSATVGIPEGSPGHYRLDVDWAVRTSNSGEFAHAAPWNGRIGSADTSNGCTNMSVEDARWFHDQSLMGDVLKTTGTDRELEWDNGWGYYQRSWEEWLDHSITGAPQVTDGSGTPGSVHGEDL